MILSQTNLEDRQRELLENLVKEYTNVFSTSSDNIGRTNVVKHMINTGSAKHIRQSAGKRCDRAVIKSVGSAYRVRQAE